MQRNKRFLLFYLLFELFLLVTLAFFVWLRNYNFSPTNAINSILFADYSTTLSTCILVYGLLISTSIFYPAYQAFRNFGVKQQFLNKKLYFTLLLAGGAFCALAQNKNSVPTQTKHDNEVWNITNNINTELSYLSYSELLAEVENEAKIKVLPAKEAQRKKTLIPKGGYLKLFVARGIVYEANMGNYTVILKDEAGKEILRKTLRESAPELAASRTYYTSSDLISLNNPPPNNAKVIVIDSRQKKRYEYLIKL